MNVATLKATWQSFNDDKVPRLASAIAYSTIFSIAPLFIVVIAIVGGLLDAGGTHGGHRSALNALLGQIRNSAGPAAADTVKQLVDASFNKPKQGIIAQILGWIFFAIGASGLFASLQDALNSIWHVEATKGGWKRMLRDRAASFGMIVVVGFLLLVTFVLNFAISFIGAHFLSAIPFAANPVVLSLIDQVVNVVVVTAIFALIYKVLPDVTLGWHDVLTGAAVTALLFVVGEVLIGLYLAHGGVASAYGAAGSLLVALIWIYYSALILLLGAEFTKINAGVAKLTTAAVIRHSSEQPAGVDPRAAAAAKTDEANASPTATTAGTSGAPDASKPRSADKAGKAPDVDEAAALRSDIEATRQRIADTAGALTYKADVPARIKDDVANRIEGVKAAFGATPPKDADPTEK